MAPLWHNIFIAGVPVLGVNNEIVPFYSPTAITAFELFNPIQVGECDTL